MKGWFLIAPDASVTKSHLTKSLHPFSTRFFSPTFPPLSFPFRLRPILTAILEFYFFLKKNRAHLLNIIIAQCPPILELFSRENQPLLIRWNAFFVLDLGLDVIDSIARFDLESDGFTRQGFNEAVNEYAPCWRGRGLINAGGLWTGDDLLVGTYICTVFLDRDENGLAGSFWQMSSRSHGSEYSLLSFWCWGLLGFVIDRLSHLW